MKTHVDRIFSARASRAGYIVFGILYSPILVLYVNLLFCGKMQGQEYVIIFPGSLLFGTYTWLLGFRIRITSDRFEYRDGLWRWHRCPLNEISGVKHAWVEFKNLGRTLKMPRMVVSRYDRPETPILINLKPFSREAIIRVSELIEMKYKSKSQ